jgi:hypothetical protein
MNDSSADDPKIARLLEIRSAIDAVMGMSPSEVVHELVGALGAQLVGAIACVTDTREVRLWEAGDAPRHLHSLRAALQATRAIVMTSSSATARAWFVGCSRQLNVSPLEVIRENTDEAGGRVVRAAFGFATQ